MAWPGSGNQAGDISSLKMTRPVERLGTAGVSLASWTVMPQKREARKATKISLRIGVEHAIWQVGGASYNTNMKAERRLGIELTWPQPPNCCGWWFVKMQIQAEELEACHREIEELQLLLQTQQALPPSRRWWWPFSR